MACTRTEEAVNFIDNVFPYTFPFSGNVIFTGPEGLRDYRPHLAPDSQIIGIGEVSREQSTDISYLFRPAPGAPMERPRSCRPGEIGWGIPKLADHAASNTGQQIVLGDFRQIAEDRSTHQYLGAWYPGPRECTPPGSDGYYKENIYSGRPGTSNARLVSASSHRHSYSPRSRYSYQLANHGRDDNAQTVSSSDGAVDRE